MGETGERATTCTELLTTRERVGRLGEFEGTKLGTIKGYPGAVGRMRRCWEPTKGPGTGTRKRGWYIGLERNFGWPGGVGFNGVTKAAERSEWAKSTDVATTMWVTVLVMGRMC